ncbi:DNA excision repair protein ERCC-1 [Vitis vinifera]|uniref:DNA excision repair protein ERCC-1 n=1 Tax=Vitis vinifera TaxID=29760 RepID=A0A438KCP3_VITVI|nr:DNA excision repair protein ERCC-1 [Vitis vinifera]
MNKEEEEKQRERDDEKKNKSSIVIKIPSYQEVLESSQSKTTSSFFTPSPSFSQAFSFVKSSQSYTPPPPATPPPPPPPSSRQVEQLEAPSSSSSSPSLSRSAQSRNAILVSHRQGMPEPKAQWLPIYGASPAKARAFLSPFVKLMAKMMKGNPLLKHIRNVRWDFADIVCDYLLGQNSCALYLSLRYHLLHPDYLYYRIRELQKNFKLRVVLCHVDVEDVIKPLLEVTRTALLHDCTLLCAWSLEECGRYLETIKVYENKSADIIQGQTDTDYLSRLTHALTTVRHVNKTDVVTLGSTFGSLSHIMDASMEDLARCPGIGERKVFFHCFLSYGPFSFLFFYPSCFLFFFLTLLQPSFQVRVSPSLYNVHDNCHIRAVTLTEAKTKAQPMLISNLTHQHQQLLGFPRAIHPY